MPQVLRSKTRPFKLRAPGAPEDDLHKQIADALRLLLIEEMPDGSPGAMWWTVEHRNAVSAIEGARRKACGVIAGLPDLWFLCRGRTFCIELKTDGGVLSDAQKKLHPRMEWHGMPLAVCRNLDQVLAQLKAWGLPVRRHS